MKPVDELTRAEAEQELTTLSAEIADHDRRYYQADRPIISDADYDALRRRNAAIEAHFPDLIRSDGPSTRIGAAPARGFAKVQHRRPMLSLANAFVAEDVDEFIARLQRFLGHAEPIAIRAEPKIDGLSLSLRYERGRLVQAATRGDGMTGEDVTRNAFAMAGIPKRLDADNAPEAIEIGRASCRERV